MQFFFLAETMSIFGVFRSMAITSLRNLFCRQRRRRPGRGFLRDSEGNLTVELALTTPIYFATMLAIFEVAMVFGTSVMLESAAGSAARAVRTGQIYLGTYPGLGETEQKEMFSAAMCDELLFMDCESLSYDVQSYENISAASVGVTCDPDGPPGDQIASSNFDIGLPFEIVVVTVAYKYEPIIPNPLFGIGLDLRNGDCNGLMMQSIQVFRNEPFPLG